MFKNICLAFLFTVAFAGSPSFASTNCDDLRIGGLSDSAVIDLKKKCIEIQNNIATSPKITVSQVEEYADLGKKYGIALSEVAKSIGTTVNELAYTPVGIFMLAIVGWKVIGHDLLGVIGGTLWFMTMLPLWVFYFNKLVLKDRKIDEKFDSTGKLTDRVVYPIYYSEGPGPAAGFLVVAILLICFAGFVMIF